MRTLLTRLTESIGDTLAKNVNNNTIFEKLSINKYSSKFIYLSSFMRDLKTKDSDLFNKLEKYFDDNKVLQNPHYVDDGQIKKDMAKEKAAQSKPKHNSSRSSSSSSGWSSGGCGSSRSSWSSGGCGSSSRSSRGGC